jgi:hypothetical protein
VNESFLLYDETEQTTTRYVGFAGEHNRYDVAITTTTHFYGKKLVFVIQTGRTAIVNDVDVSDVEYVMSEFQIRDEEEAKEFSEFLTENV